MKATMQMPMSEMNPMATMPMMMPMGMMSPMMSHMSCEMTEEGLSCTMTPVEGMSMEMMRDCCEMMNSMVERGMPCTMSCNGMPMMMVCGMPVMPEMRMEMTGDGMRCTMMAAEGMPMEMMSMCCDMMTRMMSCGMSMTMMCGNMPLMVCTH